MNTRHKPPPHVTTGVTTELPQRECCYFMYRGFKLPDTLNPSEPKVPKWANDPFLISYLFSAMAFMCDLGPKLQAHRDFAYQGISMCLISLHPITKIAIFLCHRSMVQILLAINDPDRFGISRVMISKWLFLHTPDYRTVETSNL
jgi:hypothetical protein